MQPVYIIKTKVAFLEGRLIFSESEQPEVSKRIDWLEKSWPSKKTFLF